MNGESVIVFDGRGFRRHAGVRGCGGGAREIARRSTFDGIGVKCVAFVRDEMNAAQSEKTFFVVVLLEWIQIFAAELRQYAPAFMDLGVLTGWYQ